MIVPVAVWRKLLEQAEDGVDAALVRARVPGEGGHRLTGADLDEAFGRAAEAAAHSTVTRARRPPRYSLIAVPQVRSDIDGLAVFGV